MSIRLIGFRYSVYTWAARMALAEAGLRAEFTEANPFDPLGAEALRGQHPFGRVPVLWDSDFRVYETSAILVYLLPAGDGRRLAARARQVAGIVDAYAYWPLVRQVFSHAVFRPAMGAAAEPSVVAEGLAAAPAVLAALDEIAAEGLVLGAGCGAAECHLAPMLGYFAMADAGRDMLDAYPALAAWFEAVSGRDSYLSTRPDLGELGGVI